MHVYVVGHKGLHSYIHMYVYRLARAEGQDARSGVACTPYIRHVRVSYMIDYLHV